MVSATPVVVDTEVISFIFKGHHLSPAYQAILAGRSLTVSLVTLAEIEYGMEAKNWGIRRRDLMIRFLSRFAPLLADIETAKYWARVKTGCEKRGRPISFPDAWIAAAALQLNVPLVTHNASDYESIEGLAISHGSYGRIALLVAEKVLVRPERLELPAYWFEASRSIQLSYGRTLCRKVHPSLTLNPLS